MAAIAGPTQEGCGLVTEVKRNLPPHLEPKSNAAPLVANKNRDTDNVVSRLHSSKREKLDDGS